MNTRSFYLVYPVLKSIDNGYSKLPHVFIFFKMFLRMIEPDHEDHRTHVNSFIKSTDRIKRVSVKRNRGAASLGAIQDNLVLGPAAELATVESF